MKQKSGKICIVLALLTGMLWGCGKVPASSVPQRRVVTQVDVTCAGDKQLHRHYTDPVKMENILNYLRLINCRNPMSRSSQTVAGSSCHITLTFSDGSYTRYHQKADSILLKEDGTWQKVDPEKALRLGALLDSMPSDAG